MTIFISLKMLIEINFPLHAQIRPQGVEKQQIKIYLGGMWYEVENQNYFVS